MSYIQHPSCDNEEIKDLMKSRHHILPINQIINEDCVKGMSKLPDESIDMIVTSPPYDGIRDYKGFQLDLHETGKQIYRILKDGGIAVMVIQDQTIDYGKTLTSFASYPRILLGLIHLEKFLE